MEACEVEREPDDVLVSANRPPARQLGKDAIRFSTQPSLGGRAFIVEAVKGDGRAEVQAWWLTGLPREGWQREGSTSLNLPLPAYDRLAVLVDHFLATYRVPSRSGSGDLIVCTDGPEALSERVRAGQVITLAGSCPPDEHHLHPNRYIEAAMLSLVCPAMIRSVPKDAQLRRDCKRWQKIAARDRRTAH